MDLFSEEYGRVFNAVSELAFANNFPKNQVTRDVVNRLFEILTGDYKTLLKSTAILAIGRYGNKDDALRLERIAKEKKYYTRKKFWKWFDESYLLEDINMTIKKLKRKKAL